jgi:hypothetical protein
LESPSVLIKIFQKYYILKQVNFRVSSRPYKQKEGEKKRERGRER